MNGLSLLLILWILFQLVSMPGCAVIADRFPRQPEITKNLLQREFDEIAGPPMGQPITVAVYSFLDKTGQRRPSTNMASFSTALTQGAEVFLIKALQDVGRGEWFTVLERIGVDGLTRERQLIRQMRDAYEGSNAKPLQPLLFAGILVEGGVIGYDTSTKSGGLGARYLGIGGSTQFSEDIVTVSLRVISVSTGKVLASVNVQKTLISVADHATALKFFDQGTKAFEGEIGLTVNEPGTFAVKYTIEAAVLELIKEGTRKGVWGTSPTPSPSLSKEDE